MFEIQLLGKALSERHQQLKRAIEPNLPPQQCPDHIFLIPQEADPSLRVRANVEIRLADMSLLHPDFLVLDHDRCLPLLTTGKREVVGGVQSRGFPGLEDVRHSVQENLDTVWPQAVADVLNLFVGKPFGDVILGVGILGDVDRLFLL